MHEQSKRNKGSTFSSSMSPREASVRRDLFAESKGFDKENAWDLLVYVRGCTLRTSNRGRTERPDAKLVELEC